MAIKSKPLRICLIVSAVIFLLIALFSLIMVLMFDQLFAKLVAQNLVLRNGSEIYANWLKPSIPIYFTVHLFNLTNKDEVLAGRRPHLTEVGPYVYRETRERYDVEFSSESVPKTVRFKHRIFYHFVPKLSIRPASLGKITTVDLFYTGLLSKGQQYLGDKPFVTLSPQDAMWDYSPGSLQLASFMGFAQSDKASLFGPNNGTAVTEFLINTGADDIQQLGQIIEVDGKTSVDLWDHPEANMLNGTDGSLAAPGKTVGSTIEFHVADLCRSVTSYAVGQKPTINRNDVDVIVFSGSPPNPDDPLAQWRTNMFTKEGFDPPPKGLIALAPCVQQKKGVSMPMFLSQPLFMGADPSLAAAFDGLRKPVMDEHATWVHIEPTTGFVLEAFKRVQFSVRIDNTNSDYEKMKGPLYFPLAWIEESAVVDKATLDRLHQQLLNPKKVIPLVLSIIGAVAILLSVSIIIVLLTFNRVRRSPGHAKRQSPAKGSSAKSPGSKALEAKLCTPESESAFSPWSKDNAMALNPQVPEANPLLRDKSGMETVIP